MKFKIKPHIGVNDIKFGMSQKEVEGKLPGGHYRAVRNSSPEFLMYLCQIGDLSVFHYFNDEGALSEIEFSREVNLVLNNTKLDSSAASKLKNSLTQFADDVLDDTDGFESKSLGIGVWIQDVDDDLIGSILVSP